MPDRSDRNGAWIGTAFFWPRRIEPGLGRTSPGSTRSCGRCAGLDPSIGEVKESSLLRGPRTKVAEVSNSLVIARFSPGPWWGFNGVDVLELDDVSLVRRRFKLLRGRVPTAVPLTSVSLVSVEVRPKKRGRDPQWVRMVLLFGGARKVFTGRVRDGQPFAQALTRRLTRPTA